MGDYMKIAIVDRFNNFEWHDIPIMGVHILNRVNDDEESYIDVCIKYEDYFVHPLPEGVDVYPHEFWMDLVIKNCVHIRSELNFTFTKCYNTQNLFDILEAKCSAESELLTECIIEYKKDFVGERNDANKLLRFGIFSDFSGSLEIIAEDFEIIDNYLEGRRK